MLPRAHGQAHHNMEGDGTLRRDGEGTHDSHESGDTNKEDSDKDLFDDCIDDTTAPDGANTGEGDDITTVLTTATEEERRSAMVMICQPPNEHMIEIAQHIKQDPQEVDRSWSKGHDWDSDFISTAIKRIEDASKTMLNKQNKLRIAAYLLTQR